MSTITASLVKELREQTGLGMMQCKKALSETSGDIEKAIEFLRRQGASVAAKRQGREAKEGKIVLQKSSGTVAAVVVNSETDFVAASDEFVKFAEDVATAVVTHKPGDLESLGKLALNGKSVQDTNTEIISKIGENIAIREFITENVGPNEYAETYSHMGGKIGVIVKLSADSPLPRNEAMQTLAKDIAMQVAATQPLALDPGGIPAETLEKEREIYREQTLKEGKPENMVDKIVEGKLQKFYKDTCLLKQVFVKDSKITIEKLLDKIARELKVENLQVAAYHRLQLGQ